MPALFPDVRVIGLGQSQCLMAATGGGETVDAPMSGQPVAFTRLQTLLQGDMPGVNVEVTGATNQTWVSATALIRSYNNGVDPAFWNDGTQALDTYGITARDFILTRAGANRLCVVLHYMHSQDASFASWSDTGYAANLTAFYNALNTACAPSFGRFVILPLPVGTRPTQNNSDANVGTMRRVKQALAGEVAPFAGATPLPFVIRPVHSGTPVVIGAWQTSGDFTHFIRSSAWRAVGHAAVRIAGINGFVPPPIDQPRLARAERLDATTIRASFVSPARYPLIRQGRGNGDFGLSTGTISAIGAVDNTAVAATGYATMTITASGFTASSRLQYLPDIVPYGDFVNGTTSPRGNLRPALWADPGGVTSLGENAEDVLLAQPVMHAAPHQAGVPVEFP